MEQNNTLEPLILSEEAIREIEGAVLDENSSEELSEGKGDEE